MEIEEKEPVDVCIEAGKVARKAACARDLPSSEVKSAQLTAIGVAAALQAVGGDRNGHKRS